MDDQEKKLVEDILHKVQVRAIIIGVPALLAIFFTMFSVLSSGKQGAVGNIGPIGKQGLVGKVGPKGEQGPQGANGQSAQFPSGAVIPFNLNKCPIGWNEYALAYGRFIRGIDKSGASIDPDALRSAGSVQPDMIKEHAHELSDVTSKAHGPNNQSPHGYQKGGYSLRVRYTGNAIGALAGPETRPKNVALLYCEKS